MFSVGAVVDAVWFPYYFVSFSVLVSFASLDYYQWISCPWVNRGTPDLHDNVVVV